MYLGCGVKHNRNRLCNFVRGTVSSFTIIFSYSSYRMGKTSAFKFTKHYGVAKTPR